MNKKKNRREEGKERERAGGEINSILNICVQLIPHLFVCFFSHLLMTDTGTYTHICIYCSKKPQTMFSFHRHRIQKR